MDLIRIGLMVAGILCFMAGNYLAAFCIGILYLVVLFKDLSQ